MSRLPDPRANPPYSDASAVEASGVLASLESRLATTRRADRVRLERELRRLLRRGADRAAAARLGERITASAAEVDRLAALPLALGLDPALPISPHADEIRAALAAHPIVIVAGATGSGKSTQLPKLALAAGRGAYGLIGHTQPRRIAARALADRIAQELGTRVGGAVGYQVRFDDRTGRDCRLKLMTDGILLRELAGDRELTRYDTLIIDEAHERTLNIDLLLGVMRGLCARRPELRVLVTSATIDTERLARFFDGAPVIEVSGRSYSIEVRYRPLAAVDEDDDSVELSMPEAVVAAVAELGADARTARGDVLVFLPGEQHIRESLDALRGAVDSSTELVPLFARLSSAEQERIFRPHASRRVVLATNVAETSLTVPGIRHVVDSGLARISRYSVRGKLQRLPIERISQASAEQRKGRCGREAEGVCIRLYSREDFEQREPFTPPEVLRTNLASVMLQMAVCGLGDMASFPFLDPPDARLVQDGVRLLQELEAMDAKERVTGIGRQLAALPCDPRLGRMLVAGARHACLAEICIIAAFLAVPDPRERPAQALAQADASHAAFADARSDFRMVLKLWSAWQSEAEKRSRAELRRWCREHFLSFVRLREWQQMHAELVDATRELGMRPGTARASYAALHRAILTGFAGSVGLLDERREYRAARGSRFVIAPGTPLARRPPRWVIAASLIETTRVYARMVAAVEPVWIERAASHLVRRSYGEPHWSAPDGEVRAFETVTLYDLPLIERRRVSYARIAPGEAHEIFVREALVADTPLELDFLRDNRRLRAAVERLEAKIRRRDILVDEQAEVDFYRTRIPEPISTLAAFERWLVGIDRHEPQRLRMTPADLMRRSAPDAGPEHFPDALNINTNCLPLSYVFDPRSAEDGVTLTVPESLLDSLDPERLAWHVPGLRLTKITEVLRALPKVLRRRLVPVPEQAQAVLDELAAQWSEPRPDMPPSLAFHEHLARSITRRTGEPVSAAQLSALPLPAYLRLNIRVLAAEGAEPQSAPRVLAEGRDLAVLRERLRQQSAREAPAAADHHLPVLHRVWDFGELPEQLTVERMGVRYTVFPTLADRGAGVAQTEAASRPEADALLRHGLTRLAILARSREARALMQELASDRELVLLASGLELSAGVPQALVDRIFGECFFPQAAALPRSGASFAALLEARRGLLPESAMRVTELVRSILGAWRTLRSELERVQPLLAPTTLTDIEAQLTALLAPDFITSTPGPWLGELPRYLQALSRRLNRLPAGSRRDAELVAQIAPFQEALRAEQSKRLHGPRPPALERLRWMIEEFRVSLFAQDLKTALPVSAKRLTEQLQRARAPS